MTRRPAKARKTSVCAAGSCRTLIWPGSVIVRRPEGGWRHEDCLRPGRRPRGRDAG